MLKMTLQRRINNTFENKRMLMRLFIWEMTNDVFFETHQNMV